MRNKTWGRTKTRKGEEDAQENEEKLRTREKRRHKGLWGVLDKGTEYGVKEEGENKGKEHETAYSAQASEKTHHSSRFLR